jgi:hypothetical protein
MTQYPGLLRHLIRLASTLRRGCLVSIIPLTESHLQRRLKEGFSHQNTSRIHMAFGRGIPQPLV